MRYFYDTEFFENGAACPIIPISIGMVAEDGRELYLEIAYDLFEQGERRWLESLPEWHRQNVVPHLMHYNYTCDCPKSAAMRAAVRSKTCPWVDRQEARERILSFVGKENPELWGYYADYDHVVLCQIFGRMIDLPDGWPMYTLDLKQSADQIIGSERLPQQQTGEHNALADARWNRWAFTYLDATMRNDQRERDRLARAMRTGNEGARDDESVSHD